MNWDTILLAGVGFVVLGMLVARAVVDRKAPVSSPPPSPSLTDQIKSVQAASQVRLALVTLAIGGGLIWFFLLGGWEQQTAKQMGEIHTQVAADFEAQYGIAQRNGSPVDRCVAAGLVAAGYLQAKNETAYQRWKAVESRDCAAAGMPR